MSATQKPRADSVLKTLPEERQAAITDYARDKSLKETREWLAADGIKTSEASLSAFLSWHALRLQLKRNESTVEVMLEKLQLQRPDLLPEQIQAVGQEFFTAMAMEQQDPKQWFFAQQLTLKKQALEFDREKFAESKKAEQQKALELCLEQSKAYPEVQELFKAAFAALKKAKSNK